MRELFIYYRVTEAHAAPARAAAVAMQARLTQAHPQLLMRLLRRAETVDDNQTWMETYATDPAHTQGAAGIDSALQSSIQAAALDLQPWLASPRHVEVFEAFTPCAS